MKVDSERKTYGKRMGTTAMGWLAQQSMEAYSLWMAWLYRSDPRSQQRIKDEETPPHCLKLIRRAYERDEADQKRHRRRDG